MYQQDLGDNWVDCTVKKGKSKIKNKLEMKT